MGFIKRAPNGRDPIQIRATDRRERYRELFVDQAEEFYRLRGYAVNWTQRADGAWSGVASPRMSESLTSTEANLNLWKTLSHKRQRGLLELSDGPRCVETFCKAQDMKTSKETLTELKDDGFVEQHWGGLYVVPASIRAVVAAAVEAGLVKLTYVTCRNCGTKCVARHMLTPAVGRRNESQEQRG